jgi:hypothetical protein
MRTSLVAIALVLSAPAVAQEAGDVPSKEAKSEAKPDKDVVKASVEEDAQPVKRSIPLRGHSLAYTVTPGHLTIRDDEGAPTASMFYVAYTAPSAGRPRPVTFLFNGGPGSSSMWLHLGSFGPLKVDASLPQMERPAPFRMATNPDTLLDVSDLVFIDAPTTGLSRTLGKAETKDLVGVDHDITDALDRDRIDQRVSLDCDQVGRLARLERAGLARQAHQRGPALGRGDERVARAHPALGHHQSQLLVRLRVGRDRAVGAQRDLDPRAIGKIEAFAPCAHRHARLGLGFR